MLQSNIEILPSGSGGNITGIRGLNFEIHDSVSNYNISRCYFNSITIGGGLSSNSASNIIISETISTDIKANCSTTTSPSNIVILSCIVGIDFLPFCPLGSSSTNYWTGLVCRNCIFRGASASIPSVAFINRIRDSRFENCILLNSSGGSIGVTNSIFMNCILNNNSTSLTRNISYNCIFSQNKDSVFINSIGTAFNFNSDYHLKPNSPGKNAGTDGSDIGIYGGSYPWKEGGIPFNPHFQYKKINGTTNQNGSLPVIIKVKAQDN